jgi:hypothetical protein
MDRVLSSCLNQWYPGEGRRQDLPGAHGRGLRTDQHLLQKRLAPRGVGPPHGQDREGREHARPEAENIGPAALAPAGLRPGEGSLPPGGVTSATRYRSAGGGRAAIGELERDSKVVFERTIEEEWRSPGNTFCSGPAEATTVGGSDPADGIRTLRREDLKLICFDFVSS